MTLQPIYITLVSVNLWDVTVKKNKFKLAWSLENDSGDSDPDSESMANTERNKCCVRRTSLNTEQKG
jgi:hypothetical protein